MKWGSLLMACALWVSCEDQLNVTPPNNFTDEQILEILRTGDEKKVELVLGALASGLDGNFRMAGSFNGFSGGTMNNVNGQDILVDVRGNDIVVGSAIHGASSSEFVSFYKLDNAAFKPWVGTQDATGYNYPFWKLACTPLINANKALLFLTSDIAADGIAKIKNARAAALCVRAYSYMMLMERYQKAYLHGGKDGEGMPIYTEYKINDPVAPSSADATYEFIKNDLKEAVSLFEAAGTGYTTDIPNDIDLSVAQYLLARVSLWTGDYKTCVAACEGLTANYSSFIKERNYGVPASDFPALAAGTKEAMAANNAFSSLSVNPECILGWKDGNGAMTYYYGTFNVFAGDGSGTNPIYFRVDDRLYNQIDDNDFRKANVMTSDADFTYFKDNNTQTIPAYSSLKWGATICLQQTARNEKVNTDMCYYRLSEVILMLAEAQAELGNDAAAKNTLNRLLAARTKAGAPTLTCDNYKGGKSLKELIRLQWRIEMWGENGLEYYNAKRWNTPIDRSGSTIHWSTGLTFPVEYMTYEIPIQETNYNPGWGR